MGSKRMHCFQAPTQKGPAPDFKAVFMKQYHTVLNLLAIFCILMKKNISVTF